jgi:hypothetical protein
MAWGISVISFECLWLLTMAFCVRVIVIRLKGVYPGPLAVGVAVLLLCLAAGVVAFSVSWNGTSPGILQSILDECFRKRDGLEGVVKTTSYLSGMSISAGLMIALTSSLSLLAAEAGSNRLERVRATLGDLNLVLMLSAAVLVAGVVEIQSLYAWPQVYLPKSLCSILQEISGAGVMVMGSIYSLLLFIVFGISHLALQQIGGVCVSWERRGS